ncbi:trypsin-like peptidase domain-containing protein [Acidicapsa dinghuensis]|uniref:Trypsin-like peptidase domain-containing protein n=1 Tax=Acidicapsa dinghuensis TaxID=2218256 RepID=A0ABW1EPX2_9BACT|nr:trypsin-like peptidase domain-containing protein [Acidicapsa dinghuensis]
MPSSRTFLDRLRSRRLASTFAALAVLSAAILIGSYAAHGVRGQESQGDSSDATPLKVPATSVAPNAFAQIARQVGPAVVNINTRTLPKEANNHRQQRTNPHGNRPIPQNPDDEDDNGDGGDGQDQGQGQGQGQNNFQDFFNRFFGGQAPGDGDDSGAERDSLGSGFIVDPKGYIITNNHVIENADQIYVKLSTDPETTDLGRKARVIGVDKATDLAVIKIETDKPLPTVKLGNSDSSEVGDWVIAIGSPFTLSQTVTAGIISAKNRTIDPGVTGQFQHFIQTDAAINPGNSGGPLLNMNSEVIGVNTAIYTQSSGYQGIGFAMPSNTVVQVYNDLISPNHKVTRGAIGITFREGLSASVGRVYGFKNGVLVQSVTTGGPSDKAGLKPRDIITTIDGRPIKDGNDLVSDIAGRRPGTTVRLGYLRDGKQADATVTIADRDKISTIEVADDDQPQNGGEDSGQNKLGITVREVTPATVQKLGTGGVVILSVTPGSFADQQGLEPGLVITRINRQPTATKDQFDKIVNGLKSGQDVVFEVVNPKRIQDGINFPAGTLP